MTLKKVNKYYFLHFLLIATLLLSCKKYLDVDPYNYVSDEGQTIYDKTSAEAAVRGAYRGLATLNYSSTFQNIVLQSGADIKSVNNAQTDLNVVNYDLRSDIGLVSTLWGNLYNTINRANHIIEKVPPINDVNLTPALKNQLLGEGYFIRAFSYFDLARLFGNVQIFLSPTKVVNDKAGKPNTTQTEVYNQVLEDLNQAEKLLPATVVRNRATLFTVYALRARLYLYLNQYEQAEKDASGLLANTGYKLNKPFALTSGSTESVLEYSYSVNDVNPGFSLWNGSNRALELKPDLYNLLNDSLTGGNRKILTSKNAAGNLLGALVSTTTSSSFPIRTAEIFLIRAEARAKKSTPDLTGALADLNEVRQRSSVPKFTSDKPEEVILAIENERRVEFGLEPHRWFDLVRTGRAPAVLNLNNTNKYIFPIPGGEIRTNPSLKQNPGY